MPSILTVSRNHIRNALQFLVNENPLYADIRISDEHLNLLPEYGVPSELTSVICYSDDMHALEEERDGYIVDDEDSMEQSGTS